jgi:iron complex outermembrane receptor protein
MKEVIFYTKSQNSILEVCYFVNVVLEFSKFKNIGFLLSYLLLYFGKPDPTLILMTIGTSGIKFFFTALDYATIFNTDLNVEYQFSRDLKWKGQLVYSYGKDHKKENLPFMSPLRQCTSLNYTKDKFSSEIGIQGNAIQTQFSPFYGENRTPDYAILNFSSGYSFGLENSKWSLRAGVENMLDTYYSTFSDWNNIPRQGRNFFVNLAISY